MKPILEYIISKSSKRYNIKATDETIKKIVKDELDELEHDANLNHIDVSEVTNMYRLFSCADDDLGKTYYDLNPDISKWNVSKVEDMAFMFEYCENFNCDISKWDVRNVYDMGWMFCGCKKFNQDISKWDVSNVGRHIFMFNDCPIKEEFKPKFNK